MGWPDKAADCSEWVGVVCGTWRAVSRCVCAWIDCFCMHAFPALSKADGSGDRAGGCICYSSWAGARSVSLV